MRAGLVRIQTFSARLPRHPLLRALTLVGGILLVIGLVTVGFVVGIAVLAVAMLAMLVRHWRHRLRRTPADPNIIEGQYTVVSHTK